MINLPGSFDTACRRLCSEISSDRTYSKASPWTTKVKDTEVTLGLQKGASKAVASYQVQDNGFIEFLTISGDPTTKTPLVYSEVKRLLTSNAFEVTSRTRPPGRAILLGAESLTVNVGDVVSVRPQLNATAASKFRDGATRLTTCA